jgi:hypothetical protein
MKQMNAPIHGKSVKTHDVHSYEWKKNHTAQLTGVVVITVQSVFVS